MKKIIEHIVNGYLLNESRRVYGGNSGYVGYSMSKRAAQAREEGKYPKTDFKKIYHVPDKLFNLLVNEYLIDDREWHHTSSYGNRTTFYSWTNEAVKDCYSNNLDDIKKMFRKKDYNGILSLLKQANEEESDRNYKEYQKRLSDEQLHREYLSYVGNMLRSKIPLEYQTSNNSIVNTKTMEVFTMDGERLSKRNGRRRRDNALSEWQSTLQQLRTELPSFEKWLELTK